MMQHQQPPQQFTPFTPAVRTPTQHQPTQYSSGLTVRGGDEQAFNGQKSSRICRHYQRGRCTWGEHCRFLHEGTVMPAKDDRSYGYGGGDMGGGFMAQGGQGGNMGGQGGMGQQQGGNYGGGMQDTQSRNVLLGLNQARLQAMRHAKLITALKGNYDVQPTDVPGQVQIVSAGLDPDLVTFLSESQLSAALGKLDDDDRFKEAGLLMYVVGEPSVFYSAIRQYTATGTCGHPRMDVALQAARDHGLVECMFYRSAAGCQAPKCSYEHRSLTGGAQPNPQGGNPASNPNPATNSPTMGFTGQRFTSTSSVHMEDRRPNPSGSDLGQWDHLEKVVDTLKAVGDEDANSSAWGASSNGGNQFLAVANNSNAAASGESAGSIW